MKARKTEDSTTEFKREYTEDIKKTITAFANTNGGTLSIGIADDGSVTGLDNPDDTILRVTNVVRNAIKPDVSLFVHYETEIVEGLVIGGFGPPQRKSG